MTYARNNSVARAFAILQALNDARNGLTASEVGRRTGLTPGTAHRFLTNLVQLGFAAQDKDRKLYFVGFELTLFGNKRLVLERIVRRARKSMVALSQSTGLAVYIASLEGPQVAIEDYVAPPSMVKMVHRKGTHLDAHAHSLGKCLLALLPTKEIRSIYETQTLRAHTRHTITSISGLMRSLSEARVQGYATDYEESRAGIRSVARALVNPKGRAMCAIAVEGFKHELANNIESDLVARLEEASNDIMKHVSDTRVEEDDGTSRNLKRSS